MRFSNFISPEASVIYFCYLRSFLAVEDFLRAAAAMPFSVFHASALRFYRREGNFFV